MAFRAPEASHKQSEKQTETRISVAVRVPSEFLESEDKNNSDKRRSGREKDT